jgi:hypothetical protein
MSQTTKSSPNIYVVVSRADPATTSNAYGYQFLGVFTDATAIAPFLTANSSGNQGFDGDWGNQSTNCVSQQGDVSSLTTVGDHLTTPFGAVTIHITALRTDGRTKTLYVLYNGRVQTTKPKDVNAPLVLKRCPMCAEWCEPADEDGHCSYECASGG